MGLHPDCTGNRAGREVASCRVALQGHSALPGSPPDKKLKVCQKHTFLFYAQSPDFHKLGLCYYLKILYL